MTISQMSIPEAVLVAALSGAFAFLGVLLAQLAIRERTAAETAKLLAETETIGVEAEKLRLDIEKQRQELKSETEKIPTTSQETRDEIIAEVEKFSRMAQAQLRGRAEQQELAIRAMADDDKLQNARIEAQQASALQFLAELKERFPDWSPADVQVAVDALRAMGPGE